MMHKRQDGFTIIELLIATAVFSMVLLVLTAGVLSIGRSYQRGVIETRTHTTARAIVDEVSQAMQFSGPDSKGTDGTPLNSAPAGSLGYCIGSKVYSFKQGVQVTGTTHALVSHPVNPAASCGSASAIPQNLPSTAAPGSLELLSDKMRLSKFDVRRVTGTDLYTITIRIVYGENDLICSPSTVSNTCNTDTPITATELSAGDINCKNIRSGTQFCAATELTTTVQKRI